ncbi:hypothetical protein M3J09_002463 [Ascochyta lentis]
MQRAGDTERFDERADVEWDGGWERDYGVKGTTTLSLRPPPLPESPVKSPLYKGGA